MAQYFYQLILSYYNLSLTNMFVNQKVRAERTAKKIREQLYHRIAVKIGKLKHLIRQIQPSLKNIIRRSSATELVRLMDQGQVTSLQVVLTFIERTATIGVKNNYIIDEMFQEAVIAARKCDQIRAQNKHKRSWRMGDKLDECFPPFFGVPLSLKEVILMQGRITYIGHVYPINPVPSEQPLIIDIFLQMGFIPFARTNVPPACKIVDTVNRIFSYCQNPWKKGRSCGGSSGGEGGLVGAGCSPFGIGTDIGGSVRIPCLFNGICGFKHGYRYTRKGNAFYGKYAGGMPIKSEIAPMTTSVDDLILFSQFIYDQQNYYPFIDPKKYDIYIRQTPFDNFTFETNQKLTIGYLNNIGEQYRCSASQDRVFKETLNILEAKGHRLKKIEIPELSKIYDYYLTCFLADSQISPLNEARSNEPPIKEYKLFFFLHMLPWTIRFILIWLLKKKQPRLVRLIQLSKPRSAVEVIQSINDNTKKRQEAIYTYLANENIDVWVMPGFPLPAFRHGTAGKFNYLLMHTTVWNALHYPAGVVPVGVVQEGETNFEDQYNDILTKDMKLQLKGSEGLPVGVQVISYPTNDEQVLYVMKQIESEVKFRQKYVCPVLNEEPNQ